MSNVRVAVVAFDPTWRTVLSNQKLPVGTSTYFVTRSKTWYRLLDLDISMTKILRFVHGRHGLVIVTVTP